MPAETSLQTLDPAARVQTRISPTVNLNLDRLKLLLALCVVALHCKVLGGNGTTAGYLLGNGLFRVAVPTFFLINGYFLPRPMESSASMRRWLMRVAGLYVFWMLIYSPMYVGGLDKAALLAAAKQWVIGFFHLWYLVGMLGGGLLLYLVRHRPTAQIAALALLAFLIGLALQYARVYVQIPNAFLQHFNQNDYVARNFLFIGFPFLALGYLLARHQVPRRLSSVQVRVWLAAAVLLMLAEAWFNYCHAPDTGQYFDFMLSLPLVAPALLLLVLVSPRPGPSSYTGQLSGAVYFVHPLFIGVATTVGMAYGNLMALIVALATLAVAPLVMAASQRWRFIL